MTYRTMSKHSYHGATSHSQNYEWMSIVLNQNLKNKFTDFGQLSKPMANLTTL